MLAEQSSLPTVLHYCRLSNHIDEEITDHMEFLCSSKVFNASSSELWSSFNKRSVERVLSRVFYLLHCTIVNWVIIKELLEFLLGWSKSSKTMPSASPRKLRVFRGLPSKIPQTFKLFEGYPRKFFNLLCCLRPQPRISRFSRLPSKKPQMGKLTYFSRILEKPRILELYFKVTNI